MRIRKPIHELTPADLKQFAVWEFALDGEDVPGQDETTVRPFVVVEELDPAEGMFIVRATFILADGTNMPGYLTPGAGVENDLGLVQPAIVTDLGQVSFWCGVIEPDAAHIAESYLILGKQPHQVFPVAFSSQVKLATGIVAGTVPGFLVLRDFRSGKVEVIQ